jgi:NNP family nitrate/nitrite transporter-like MFS transporter
MLFSAIPMYLMGQANSFNEYMLYSLGFGMTGTSFAVGIAFSSVWFPKKRQGTALGIFGAGNAGAALIPITRLIHFLTGTNSISLGALPGRN